MGPSFRVQVPLDFGSIWRRMMFRGEFDSRTMSLKFEWGGMFSCSWVLSFVRINYLLALWATTQNKFAPKMAFKFSIRDTHHPINGLWPSLEHADELHISNFKFLTCMIVNFAHVRIFQLMDRIHSLTQFQKTQYFSLATPNLSQLCDRSWSSHLFSSRLRYEVGFYIQVSHQNKCWW